MTREEFDKAFEKKFGVTEDYYQMLAAAIWGFTEGMKQACDVAQSPTAKGRILAAIKEFEDDKA